MTHPIQQEQNPELWKPAGMPEWKVGMRVRVRVSGECSVSCVSCWGAIFHKIGEGIGIIEADGRTDKWTTVRCRACGNLEPTAHFIQRTGHRYAVRIPDGRGVFAASELTLLSDEGRER